MYKRALFCILNNRELAISYLTTELYILLGVDHNLLLSVDGDDLRGAIRVAGMVNEAPVGETKRSEDVCEIKRVRGGA